MFACGSYDKIPNLAVNMYSDEREICLFIPFVIKRMGHCALSLFMITVLATSLQYPKSGVGYN